MSRVMREAEEQAMEDGRALEQYVVSPDDYEALRNYVWGMTPYTDSSSVAGINIAVNGGICKIVRANA